MSLHAYFEVLLHTLSQIESREAGHIRDAAALVADAIGKTGIVHVFGSGHSHMLAEEAFYRAGGLAPVNPVLDERLIFLKGALESTRCERTEGLGAQLAKDQQARPEDACIVASNSGRNAAPVEFALAMRALGVPVIAITNLDQSRAALSRHSSGKRLFEVANVVVDTCVPEGDAAVEVPGANVAMGPASTVAGAAIINAIMIEAAACLVARGVAAPVFRSANVPGRPEGELEDLVRRYSDRIRLLP
jgi:uncharacterized phosphosugar-binding protein